MQTYLLKIPELKLISFRDTTDFITHYPVINQTILNELKQTHQSYDVYTQQDCSKVYTPIHYHEDNESRLILKGSATFYIVMDNVLHIIDARPGDRISIPPNTLHWFKCAEELIALRLFEKCDKHTMQIPSNIDDSLSEIHKKLRNKLEITI